MQSGGQGAQIGEFSSRPLEAPRHEIIICIKIIHKDMIGLGQGVQIWEVLL